MQIGRLLGQGKVAEVYEAGGDVLKLYRAGIGPEQAQREASILDAIGSTSLAVPRALGVMQHDGRWGLLMSRMHGRPLAERADIAGMAEVLAGLHRQVHELAGTGLPLLVARLGDRIGRASGLTAIERARLIERLAALPQDDRLCHGDFHPFNIMVDGTEPAIIDWLDATSGPPAADVGRSYLLLLHNARELAEPYLDARLQGASFSRQIVADWLPVLAGARLAEDVPDETGRLLDLVRQA